MMNNILLRLVALVTTVGLAGCLGALIPEEDKAIATGNYDQAITLYDSKYSSLSAMNRYELSKYCSVSHSVKRYDKLQNCLAILT